MSYPATSEHISFQHHHLIIDVPMYAHFSTQIKIFIKEFMNSIFFYSIYCARLTLCVKTISLAAHTIQCTRALETFLYGFKQLSASTLNHILRYKLLPVAIYGVYN